MMRRFLISASALLVAGVACGQFKANQTSTAGVQTSTMVTPATESLDSAKRIDRETAIEMVKDKQAVYVDVRPKAEYEAGHIAGAINIPLGELLTRLKDLPPKKYLITYCA
jgi:3-mercaptopyruvate sulfurtransferase SseA